MKSISHWIAAAALMLSGTAAHAEPVTLDIWTIDRPDQYIYLLKDEFEQAHPDIKLNVKTVQFRDMVNDLARATATGESPDVTYIDNPEVALFAS
ncbi:MAG: extracellular solute-binding protein, partial [Phyllobacterium sp.]|nr:extracellular solute-binding protein [Phyllobacterium sp.]